MLCRISKAFDTVNGNALFYKLKQVGITEKVFDLIKKKVCTLQHYTALKKENYISKPRVNNIGLKQGDSLSPTRFNIFLMI